MYAMNSADGSILASPCGTPRSFLLQSRSILLWSNRLIAHRMQRFLMRLRQDILALARKVEGGLHWRPWSCEYASGGQDLLSWRPACLDTNLKRWPDFFLDGCIYDWATNIDTILSLTRCFTTIYWCLNCTTSTTKKFWWHIYPKR